jgi:1-acyl-sn-glycerol-3-phosphate acyltransferase
MTKKKRASPRAGNEESGGARDASNAIGKGNLKGTRDPRGKRGKPGPRVPRPSPSSAAPTAVTLPPEPVAPSVEAPTVRQLPVDPSPSDVDVGAQIRALEERLDKMIGEAQRRSSTDTEPASRGVRSGRGPHGTLAPPEASEETVFDTARELLSTDFYLRKWGRLGMRNRSEEVDDFGKDPVYEERVMPLFNFLYEHYFRVECEGIANIPDEGRCLLVSNHSGTIPYDGAMLKVAVAKEHRKHRDVRWLAEDFIFHFPFLGSFTNRIGAVRACQENAERLLRQEALVAVFPEGIKGIGKLWKERYKLQRFGRGGFIKLCLRTGTPVVPVAVVGAEETHPMLLRLQTLANTVGLPYIPVTPTFPLLGPLGLLPAPAKWKILIGPPVRFDEHGPEAEGDEILVARLAEQVRGSIQEMLDRAVGARKSVWFG